MMNINLNKEDLVVVNSKFGKIALIKVNNKFYCSTKRVSEISGLTDEYVTKVCDDYIDVTYSLINLKFVDLNSINKFKNNSKAVELYYILSEEIFCNEDLKVINNIEVENCGSFDEIVEEIVEVDNIDSMDNIKLEVFKNTEFGELETFKDGEKIYFPASKCAEILGYKSPKDAIYKHCKRAIKRCYVTGTRATRVKFIPEGDLYRLIIRSKLPSAERFESWVFDEVLPQIRKTGGYIPVRDNDSDAEIMAKALQIATKTLANKDAIIEQKQMIIDMQEPKVKYYNAIMDSDELVNTTVIAKQYGMSARKLNSLLNELKVQYKSGEIWVLYSKFDNCGYTNIISNVNDYGYTYSQQKWTQKGKKFIFDLLKEKKGMLPNFN